MNRSNWGIGGAGLFGPGFSWKKKRKAGVLENEQQTEVFAWKSELARGKGALAGGCRRARVARDLAH